MNNSKTTKKELVQNVYNTISVDKQTIQKTIDCFLEQLRKSMEEGNTIELRGFGTFEPRLRKGKSSARNPKTGEKVKVEPHYVIAFRAGQELKEKLWKLDPSKMENK